MSSNRPVRWGILGSHWISEVMAEAIIASDSGQLQAIASRTNAKKFAEKFSLSTMYSDYDLLLRDPEIDAVYITKAFLILFILFYAIFSLMIFRQIQIMAKTLPTSLSPWLKFIGIVQIGISLGLLFVVIGAF